MRIKKLLLAIPFTLAAVIAVGWIASPTVQAHNALATPSCTGLSWSATNYQKEVVNSIVVKVDGTIVHQDPDFKASDVGTVVWSQTAPHTWSVVVNAPGANFDRSFAGTWQACVVTTTTPVTTVAPTTTVPQATTTVPVTTVPATTTVPQATTTTLVAQCCPPVPCQYNPAVPAGSPLCAPPSTVSDVAVLVPANPPLPVTGAGDTIAILAAILVGAGAIAYLVSKGRRVP